MIAPSHPDLVFAEVPGPFPPADEVHSPGAVFSFSARTSKTPICSSESTFTAMAALWLRLALRPAWQPWQRCQLKAMKPTRNAYHASSMHFCFMNSEIYSKFQWFSMFSTDFWWFPPHGKFPKIGLPLVTIQFRLGFSTINHLFVGYPHLWKSPHIPITNHHSPKIWIYMVLYQYL